MQSDESGRGGVGQNGPSSDQQLPIFSEQRWQDLEILRYSRAGRNRTSAAPRLGRSVGMPVAYYRITRSGHASTQTESWAACTPTNHMSSLCGVQCHMSCTPSLLVDPLVLCKANHTEVGPPSATNERVSCYRAMP